MQNWRHRCLSSDEKLTASGSSQQSPVFGIALPLTSTKGSAHWPQWELTPDP